MKVEDGGGKERGPWFDIEDINSLILKEPMERLGLALMFRR